MNFENEPQPHAPKRRDISLFEGIRTFAASVGTAALLMLSVCGLIGLPLPENATAHAVSASHITAKTETVRTVQLGGDVFGIKLFSDGVIVAALSEIYADGGLKCPASEAGIQPGDYILSVNGNNVETNAALSTVLSENETNTLTLRRGTETFTAQRERVRFVFGKHSGKRSVRLYVIAVYGKDIIAGLNTGFACRAF